MMKKNVRLEDIAKRLNLTKVSISKALRDHPDISLETRKRVKKLADEMGYFPNQVARSLTSRRTRTIGVIVPKIAHFFFSYVIEGIYNAAAENNYEVILGVSMEDRELERKHLESILKMRVDGLLVSVTEETEDVKTFDVARDMGIHLLFFDRVFENVGISVVKVEDLESAAKGTRHLIGLGHRNIAHLAGFETIDIGRNREKGYRQAMEAAGLEVADTAVVHGGFSEEDGYRGFQKLMETHGKPEALFTVTYPVGLGVLEYMRDHGMDPAEMPILAFGKSDFNRYLSSPFICIDQPTVELGRVAVEQLLKEIEAGDDEKFEPQMIRLPAGVLPPENGRRTGFRDETR